MANTVLFGAQWGDEGKGKIIDVLTAQADWVVRYQGGNNAGHTVEIGEEKYVLHLIPSGILHHDKKCIIGNGVVVDIVALLEELDGLRARGISPEGRLFLSDRAHLVFPYHRNLDEVREGRLQAGDKIGTTKRGIGPCYGDKASRIGLRMCDLLRDDFKELLAASIERQNLVLTAMGGTALDVNSVVQQYVDAAEQVKPFIADCMLLLHEAMQKNEPVLFEGAQGTMLDIDHGTYPFVTSSNATAGGACAGAAIPPNRMDHVVGVVKAYTTRVGEGPFPTELHDETGEFLRKEGNEFGATTGRPRRCGWFDAVVATYSAKLNGVNEWAVTKMDVLDKLETLKVCVAYECNGKRYESVPADARILSECKPVYEEVPGWNCSTRDVRSYDELPQKAKDYLAYLEKLTGVPAGIISLGPKRESTLVLKQSKKA